MSDQESKKQYEIAFLLKSQEDESDLAELLKQFSVEVSYKSPLNEIRLAYPIKKRQQAYFGFLQFNSLPEKVEKLNQALNLSPLVLRTLVVLAGSPAAKSERGRVSRADFRSHAPKLSEEIAPQPATRGGALSNEALEKKLEEILK